MPMTSETAELREEKVGGRNGDLNKVLNVKSLLFNLLHY